MRHTLLLPALGVALLLAACNDTNEPDGERRRGIISPDLARTLDIPDTIRVGANVIATVTTMGSEGCSVPAVPRFTTEAGTAERITSLRIEVYDEWKLGDDSCPTTLVPMPLEIRLKGDRAGPVAVSVVGRASASDGPQVANVTVVDTVQVVP